MAKYIIYPLRVGTITRPQSNMAKGDSDEKAEFPINAYYLESDEHKIVVDTGGDAPETSIWQPYTRSAAEEQTNALRQLGVEPDEIDIVLFTHLHWDHACGNAAFKNARFIAQGKELEALANTDIKGYEHEISGATKYESVEGDVSIVSGIRAVLVPGHSAGSQAFFVDTEEGEYLITGDLIPMRGNWETNPKTPSSTIEDEKQLFESFEKLEKTGITADRLLPGHDPAVHQRKQYGA